MEVRASPAASHVVVRDLVLARAKHEITNDPRARARACLLVRSAHRAAPTAPQLRSGTVVNSLPVTTTTEATDVEALEREFPGLLTPFASFLEETRWGDVDATYDDLATLTL